MDPTHFLVEDKPLFDSTIGPDGGVVMTYTGTARQHPWTHRAGELVMDGRGVAKLNNGDVYEGETKLGMFHGDGKMTYANGDIYDGNWVDHMPDGYGVFEGADGSSYTGIFRRGERNGMGDETRIGAKFVGAYKAGKRDGVGRIVLESGTIIDGVFREGRLDGLCTITYASGDMFVGRFRNGLMHGPGSYTQCDTNDIFHEEFRYGLCVRGVLEADEDPALLPPGEQPVFSEFEQHELRNHQADVRAEGKDPTCHVTYAASGDTYEGEWLRTSKGGNRRGIRAGKGRLHHKATGIVYEGQFVDDVKEGEGALLMPKPEVDEDADSTASPYVVRIECAFHNDQLHGKALVTLSDGATREEFYSKGDRHGISHEHPAAPRYAGEVRSAMFERDVRGELDYHLRSTEVQSIE